MKHLGLFLLYLILGWTALAQNTTVSGTIVDTDGTVWANGSWQAQLINPNGGVPLYCNSGGAVVTQYSGVLNGSGAFSQVMADNTQVCPAGTLWQFTFASHTSAQASQITALVISGATFDISSYATLNITAPRIKIGNLAGIYAYIDAEIVNQTPGNIYWNVSSLATRQWTGSIWQDLVIGTGYLPLTGGTLTGPLFIPLAAGGTMQVTMFGDSLTAGGEDNTGATIENRLSRLLGQAALNYGIGGQTSSQIAVRMNAYAGQTAQTFATGFTIPVSGAVSGVQFQTGFGPAYNLETGSFGPYVAGVPISTVVSSVTYTMNCLDSGDHVNYTCTPTAYPSSPIAVPNGNPWLAANLGNALNGFVVIWAGRNNFYSESQVLADVAAMVAALPNPKRYVVLAIPNAEYEPSGSGDYAAIVALNNALAAAYPNNYIDIRAGLVAQYNPSNGLDVADHTNDIPPSTLRAGDAWGQLTSAITDTTTLAFTTTTALGAGVNIQIDSEYICITGGSNGAYTGSRGCGGTTAATHLNNAGYAGIDPLHIGSNTIAANNTWDNGETYIASVLYSWLLAEDAIAPRATPKQQVDQATSSGPGLYPSAHQQFSCL